jgi:single-stranded-DNA-specific exonuclease
LRRTGGAWSIGRVQVQIREADPPAAAALARQLGVSGATAQILLHRGLREEALARAYLSPRLADLTRPDGMADREIAADRLARAVRAGERIAIFGDYDVDGTTSAAILAGILERLGGHVTVQLASRFEGGYGLSAGALERVLETAPGVLVTCDCGSSDHPRIEAARGRGIDVIVVDHHLVPAEPLPALAFLNPHRPDCGFAYKGLCSAGLALSLGAAVRARLGIELDMRSWLDLVALGTIADVAPLDGDNRRLVRAGLSLLASAQARPGVAALRELAKIPQGTCVGAHDVAFRMTPRLNAAGRLGDPMLTLALLRARDMPEARSLAARVEQLNEQRKAIEAEVTNQAIAQVIAVYGESPTTGIVAAGEGWHRGVVGISAARVCERFGVPAVVIALQDGVGHGSCRAPDGFQLFDAVARCARQLERFGGHQAASGLTLRAERVDAFRADFAGATALAHGSEGSARVTTHVDVVVDDDGYSLPPASDLQRLEPLGEANIEPVFFLPRARVESSGVVGRGHLKLKLSAGGGRLSAFGLDMGDRMPEPGSSIAAVGALRPDTWNGGDHVELRLVDFE